MSTTDPSITPYTARSTSPQRTQSSSNPQIQKIQNLAAEWIQKTAHNQQRSNYLDTFIGRLSDPNQESLTSVVDKTERALLSALNQVPREIQETICNQVIGAVSSLSDPQVKEMNQQSIQLKKDLKDLDQYQDLLQDPTNPIRCAVDERAVELKINPTPLSRVLLEKEEIVRNRLQISPIDFLYQNFSQEDIDHVYRKGASSFILSMPNFLKKRALEAERLGNPRDEILTFAAKAKEKTRSDAMNRLERDPETGDPYFFTQEEIDQINCLPQEDIDILKKKHLVNYTKPLLRILWCYRGESLEEQKELIRYLDAHLTKMILSVVEKYKVQDFILPNGRIIKRTEEQAFPLVACLKFNVQQLVDLMTLPEEKRRPLTGGFTWVGAADGLTIEQRLQRVSERPPFLNALEKEAAQKLGLSPIVFQEQQFNPQEVDCILDLSDEDLSSLKSLRPFVLKTALRHVFLKPLDDREKSERLLRFSQLQKTVEAKTRIEKDKLPSRCYPSEKTVEKVSHLLNKSTKEIAQWELNEEELNQVLDLFNPNNTSLSISNDRQTFLSIPPFLKKIALQWILLPKPTSGFDPSEKDKLLTQRKNAYFELERLELLAKQGSYKTAQERLGMGDLQFALWGFTKNEIDRINCLPLNNQQTDKLTLRFLKENPHLPIKLFLFASTASYDPSKRDRYFSTHFPKEEEQKAFLELEKSRCLFTDPFLPDKPLLTNPLFLSLRKPEVDQLLSIKTNPAKTLQWGDSFLGKWNEEGDPIEQKERIFEVIQKRAEGETLVQQLLDATYIVTGELTPQEIYQIIHLDPDVLNKIKENNDLFSIRYSLKIMRSKTTEQGKIEGLALISRKQELIKQLPGLFTKRHSPPNWIELEDELLLLLVEGYNQNSTDHLFLVSVGRHLDELNSPITREEAKKNLRSTLNNSPYKSREKFLATELKKSIDFIRNLNLTPDQLHNIDRLIGRVRKDNLFLEDPHPEAPHVWVQAANEWDTQFHPFQKFIKKEWSLPELIAFLNQCVEDIERHRRIDAAVREDAEARRRAAREEAEARRRLEQPPMPAPINPFNPRVQPLAVQAQRGLNVHDQDRDKKTEAAVALLKQFVERELRGEPSETDVESYYATFSENLRLNKYGASPEEKEKAILALESRDPNTFGGLIYDISIKGLYKIPNGKTLLYYFLKFIEIQTRDGDKENLYLAFVKALADASDRVCPQGKAQRLSVAVLQGRLGGVQIDQEASYVSIERLVKHLEDAFFANEANRGDEATQPYLRSKYWLKQTATTFFEKEEKDSEVIRNMSQAQKNELKERFVQKIEEFGDIDDRLPQTIWRSK